MLETDARMWAMLVNLATVVGAVLTGGTLTIVAILVIWLVYRERSALIDFHGKQQVNLAITTVLAAIVAGFGTLITFFIGGFVFIPLMITYFIYTVVISIIAAVAANRGEYYKIPLIIRLIK